MLRILTLSLLALSLTHCSSINEYLYKDKCTGGDWETVGEQDGRSGQSNYGSWVSRCQQFDAKPDKAAYLRGVEAGIPEYCYNTGYNNGKAGRNSSTPSKCTKSTLKMKITEGFKTGLAEYCTTDLGQSHGAAGQPKNKACSAKQEYSMGYASGINQFCQPKRAFQLGTEGKTVDTANCPINLKTSILRAHSSGKQITAVRQESTRLQAEIDDLQKKLYDPATPADAKPHYEQILNTKRAALQTSQRKLFRLEESTRRYTL